MGIFTTSYIAEGVSIENVAKLLALGFIGQQKN